MSFEPVSKAKVPSRFQAGALWRKPAPSRDGVAPPLGQSRPHATGQPLDREARSYLEARFGHDFSRVQVHNDGSSAQHAQHLHTPLYAAGNGLVFGEGQYDPHTPSGRGLMAAGLMRLMGQGEHPVHPLGTSAHDPQVSENSRRAGEALSGRHSPEGAHAHPVRPGAAAPSLKDNPITSEQDPRSPLQYPNFESFAAGYQSAVHARVPKAELQKMWKRGQVIKAKRHHKPKALPLSALRGMVRPAPNRGGQAAGARTQAPPGASQPKASKPLPPQAMRGKPVNAQQSKGPKPAAKRAPQTAPRPAPRSAPGPTAAPAPRQVNR